MDGVKIPTLAALEELVAATAPKGFRLYTELKTDMGPNPDQAHRLADAYLAALENRPWQSNIVSSHLIGGRSIACVRRGPTSNTLIRRWNLPIPIRLYESAAHDTARRRHSRRLGKRRAVV